MSSVAANRKLRKGGWHLLFIITLILHKVVLDFPLVLCVKVFLPVSCQDEGKEAPHDPRPPPEAL